jgi:predicted RNA-binding Zn ribbon-like protein
MDEPSTPGHRRSPAPAPGDLERLRDFLGLHDHVAGDPNGSIPPSRATVSAWLRANGTAGTPSEEELDLAIRTRSDLRSLVAETMGAPRDEDAVARLESLVHDAGLTIRIAEGDLRVAGRGVRADLGRLLAIAFLARRDGTWERLRMCANGHCEAVFFDRSKNRSGRWCDMASCGNRAKVRAYRERHRTEADR